MMIPIKIQCGCGQRYAFDVEPVGGRMPSAIACPACGADGTEAANAFIARTLTAQPVVAIPPPPSVEPDAAPAPAPVAARRGPPRPQIDRARLEHEARAKVLWGDSPEDVVKFLMLEGLNRDEASEMVEPLVRERTATIRVNGIRKTVIGAVLMCVPVAAYFVFTTMGVMSFRLFGLTIMVGLWGGWMLLTGAIMLLTPKSERGDVAEQ